MPLSLRSSLGFQSPHSPVRACIVLGFSTPKEVTNRKQKLAYSVSLHPEVEEPWGYCIVPQRFLVGLSPTSPAHTKQPHFLSSPSLFTFLLLHLSFLHLPNLFSQILDSEAISGRSEAKAVICFFSGIDKHRHDKYWTRNGLCLRALTIFWWRGRDESDNIQAPAYTVHMKSAPWNPDSSPRRGVRCPSGQMISAW